ncbi:MAG: hypothetical protein IPH44_29090 [Myxococcales bacterium]|nr:hypothetical protein [Myxococcales bacterium]
MAPRKKSTSTTVWCPDRSKSATVYSRDVDNGYTQVLVEFHQHGSGGGVFDVSLPGMPIEARWLDDDTLCIAYPAEAPLEAYNRREDQTHCFEQVVQIRYETFTGHGALVAEAIARRDLFHSTPQPASPRKPLTHKGRQLRGTIVKADNRFRYDYYDVDEPDSSAEFLTASGYQGGGPSWAGIVYGLLALRQPALLPKIEFDEEADGLSVWSRTRATLLSIADVVTAAKEDPALLTAAIAEAVKAGRME